MTENEFKIVRGLKTILCIPINILQEKTFQRLSKYLKVKKLKLKKKNFQKI